MIIILLSTDPLFYCLQYSTRTLCQFKNKLLFYFLSFFLPLFYSIRQAWQSLGDMKKEDAMKEFMDLLNRVCQLFKPFMQAQLAEKEDKERRKLV